MEISITTSATARAVETSSATSVLPDHIEYDASELMKLISAYYDHINTTGLPSYEVNNLTKNHDVDLASERYLDAIERQIAINIPQTQVLDRRRLYKLITDYYLTRGSDDSILTFFRLFYNEVVTLLFPKDFLLDSSGLNGMPSDNFKIRDSYFWQEFSYVINSGSDQARWRNEFLKFVHPAGLKLFVALTITGIALNDWLDEPPEYLIGDYENTDECDWWKIINWSKFYGQHSPKIQPCIDVDFEFILKSLMGDGGKHYLTHIRDIYSEDTESLSDTNLLSSFFRLLVISYRIYNNTNQIGLFHDEYILSSYRRDPSSFVEGYSEYTIEDTYETPITPRKYDPNSTDNFSAYSHKNVKDSYGFSYENEIEASEVNAENTWSDGNSPVSYVYDPTRTSNISLQEQYDYSNRQIVITNDENLDSPPVTKDIIFRSHFVFTARDIPRIVRMGGAELYVSNLDGGSKVLNLDNGFENIATLTHSFNYPAAIPPYGDYRVESFPTSSNSVIDYLAVSTRDKSSDPLISRDSHEIERGFFGDVIVVDRDSAPSFFPDGGAFDEDCVFDLPPIYIDFYWDNVTGYRATIVNGRSDYSAIGEYENSVISQQKTEDLVRPLPTVDMDEILNTNNFRGPDGVSIYHQPDGVSRYKFP